MGKPKSKIKLFEHKQVRAVWDEEAEKWWFSILDIIGILTEQPDYEKVRNYWKWLKNKLKEEGSELVSNTNQLKMLTPDGKKRFTDVANTEQNQRLIQTAFKKRLIILNYFYRGKIENKIYKTQRFYCGR